MLFLNKIKKHWQVSAACGASVIISIYSVADVYFSLKNVPPPLVVHFISGEGVVRTGTLFEIVAQGLLGLCFVTINSFLAIELEEKDWFWGKFVSVFTIAISLLLFMGARAIIGVN